MNKLFLTLGFLAISGTLTSNAYCGTYQGSPEAKTVFQALVNSGVALSRDTDGNETVAASKLDCAQSRVSDCSAQADGKDIEIKNAAPFLKALLRQKALADAPRDEPDVAKYQADKVTCRYGASYGLDGNFYSCEVTMTAGF